MRLGGVTAAGRRRGSRVPFQVAIQDPEQLAFDIRDAPDTPEPGTPVGRPREAVDATLAPDRKLEVVPKAPDAGRARGNDSRLDARRSQGIAARGRAVGELPQETRWRCHPAMLADALRAARSCRWPVWRLSAAWAAGRHSAALVLTSATYDRVVFTPEERDHLRASLIEEARQDSRITAAALVGSAATGTEDRWSDIDLALRLAPGHVPSDVALSWTRVLTDTHGAIAHTDVWSGSTLYRVFLLPSSLQVDVSFWPDHEFRAAGGPLSLAFGEVNEPAPPSPDPSGQLVGMAWLFALHVRSSIARRRGLQAVSMLNGMREQVVSLACLRLGLPPYQGRGVDRLPDGLKHDLEATLARSTATAELARNFGLLADLLAAQVAHIDTAAARNLEPVLRELVRTSTPEMD